MAARVHSLPGWQRAIFVLSSAIAGIATILILQWGRPVLIPIALAILLTFLLNPIVRALQRRGLRRVFAVMIAVLTAGFLLMGLGWMVSRQVANLVAEIPHHTDKIKAKVKSLRELGSGPMADQFAQMADEISKDFQIASDRKNIADESSPDHKRPELSPETVILSRDSIPWLTLTGYLGSALEVLATLAFSLVLLVFFLLGREDLRDRIVMLAGKTRLAFTSKAVEDANNRISRYIVMVALVNGGFGIVLTAALFLLGVPYPLLWGFIAAGLRFIPYIGAWVGAAFPIIMSLATSEGWTQPFAVLGCVMALELICGNVVEPFVFGHSIGVSPTALVISAAFWLYLWGPIGLVLSAPFAVCLVVLGKNIPQLAFLNLLLGDAPALQAHLGVYQRLMLGDEFEAVRLVTHRIKESSIEKAFDQMLVPALNYTKQDVMREYLSDEDQQTILRGIKHTLEAAETYRPELVIEHSNVANEAQSDATEKPVTVPKPRKILGCPASDELDVTALALLGSVLDPAQWELELVSVETLITELMTRIVDDPPAVICIASLPPGGMAQARYLCKRLRSVAPDVHIIVGRWGQKQNLKLELERLEQVGANFVTNSLADTHQVIEKRLLSVSGVPLRPSSRFKFHHRKVGAEPVRSEIHD